MVRELLADHGVGLLRVTRHHGVDHLSNRQLLFVVVPHGHKLPGLEQDVEQAVAIVLGLFRVPGEPKVLDPYDHFLFIRNLVAP